MRSIRIRIHIDGGSMDKTSLLFDRAHSFLGEVVTRDGGMTHAMLTAEGEAKLGAQLKDWQMRGVPVLHEVTKSEGKGHAPVFYQERVQTRMSQFLNALHGWVERNGMALVTIGREPQECWEMIVRLPLEPRERFSIIVSIRDAATAEILKCKAALHDAVHIADVQHEKTQAAIKTLWDSAGQELATKLKKKSVHVN